MANAARTASPEIDRAPTRSAPRTAGGPLNWCRCRCLRGSRRGRGGSGGRRGCGSSRRGRGRRLAGRRVGRSGSGSSRPGRRGGYRRRRRRIGCRGRRGPPDGRCHRRGRSGRCGAAGILGTLRVRGQLEASDDADESDDRSRTREVARPSCRMDGASHRCGSIPRRTSHRSHSRESGSGSGSDMRSTRSSDLRTHAVRPEESGSPVRGSWPRGPDRSARGMQPSHRPWSWSVSPLGWL